MEHTTSMPGSLQPTLSSGQRQFTGYHHTHDTRQCKQCPYTIQRAIRIMQHNRTLNRHSKLMIAAKQCDSLPGEAIYRNHSLFYPADKPGANLIVTGGAFIFKTPHDRANDLYQLPPIGIAQIGELFSPVIGIKPYV